ARIDAFKAVPVVGKDLFEEAPGRRSGCSHQAASLRSMGLGIVALLYHVSLTTSTTSSARSRYPPPPTSPLYHGDVRAIAKWEFLCDQDMNGFHFLYYRPVNLDQNRLFYEIRKEIETHKIDRVVIDSVSSLPLV